MGCLQLLRFIKLDFKTATKLLILKFLLPLKLIYQKKWMEFSVHMNVSQRKSLLLS